MQPTRSLGVTAQRPQRRKRAAYLSRLCVSADALVTMRRPAGTGCRHIFRPRGRKQSFNVHLRRPIGDALKKTGLSNYANGYSPHIFK
jgi:hypothetical protein